MNFFNYMKTYATVWVQLLKSRIERSVTRISFGPMKAMALGALRPLVINWDFRLESVKFWVSNVIFALANTGDTKCHKENEERTKIVKNTVIIIMKF